VARAARYSSRVDVIVFVGCLLTSLILIVLSQERREPIAEALRRTVMAPLVGMQSGAERWRMAWLESERRMLKTDTLALQAFRVHALQRENEQLRRLIGLGSALEGGFVPAEALRPTTREDIVQTVTLTAGTRVGVQRYDAVVSPDGVVGMVQTTEPSFSLAILFSHPDFRASSMTVDGTAYGIVYPRLGSDAGQYLLELRGVPLRYDIKPGTLILTAGLGGTFPKGIPIGNVIKEVRTPEVWTRTYLVQPAVNPTKLSAVMILRSRNATAVAERAWRNVAAVDSAVRRIMSAGDSIARQDSLAAAVARTAAATDSARRADPAAFAADSARADSVRRGRERARTPPSNTAPAQTNTAPAQTPSATQPRPTPAPARTAAPVGPPAPATDSATNTTPRVSPPRRDSVRPDTVRPAGALPDTIRPVRPPDSTRPDSTRPDSTRPDDSGLEAAAPQEGRP
jgi:rod shape-determining protein MreC